MNQVVNREDNASPQQMMNNLNIQPQPCAPPRPNTWMGVLLLNRYVPVPNSGKIQNPDYCAICVPRGKPCPHHNPRDFRNQEWSNTDSEPELEILRRGERQDSDWEEDLKKDNMAKAPLRLHRHLPKVLLFQKRQPLANWLSQEVTKPPLTGLLA